MADYLPFIFLQRNPVQYDYKGKGGGSPPDLPTRNRRQHGKALLNELNTSVNRIEEVRNERRIQGLPVNQGSYLQFESKPGYELATKSLENINRKIRLLNIQEKGENEDDKVITASVYVPPNQEVIFRKKINGYLTETTEAGQPKNKPLIDSIEHISIVSIYSLWTDDINLIPGQAPAWCELWLNINQTDEEQIEDVQNIFDIINITYRESVLSFPEREVLLIFCNGAQLNEFILQCDLIAEIRLLKETANFWLQQRNQEQVSWNQELLQRAEFSYQGTGICLLDTGVNNGHMLLAPAIADEDCLALFPDWGTNDHDGHGTTMAGVLVYGDLQFLLESQENFKIRHRVTSIKILPPRGQNDKDLYGALTSQAISLAEIQNPKRQQLYCMAVTCDEKIKRGKPTSWSACIDQLAFGEDETKRLIILSAGNVRNNDEYSSYPHSNLTISVEDPAHAWNALTIGAITNKVMITDPDYTDHTPLADYGYLSPYSSTSLTWERRKWPLKPDIVLEGGNVLKAPDNSTIANVDDVSILSTSSRPLNNQFDSISGTSPASAYGSWFGVQIQNSYINAWPETIRGLMIHSARWTNELISQFNLDISKKTDLATLMRICGYGVPDIEKALYCNRNSFTVIAQKKIKPFGLSEKGKRCVFQDMHLYQLPWPKDLLLGLGETDIKLKITLSYFIEPSPADLGWEHRYRYQSFGLRFDLNTPGEDEKTFLKRINIAQREEDEKVNAQNDSGRWKIGTTLRNLGSVHSDTIETTAAEIATCNLISIYPVTGWWRERKYLERWRNEVRYSLIITLETPSEEIDIYTPINNLISIPVEIPIVAKKAKK